MYLLIIPDLNKIGGAEKIILDLYNHLKGKGYNCKLACLQPSPMIDDELTFDISKNFLSALLKASKFIENNDISIVNAHLKKAIIFCRIFIILDLL